MGISRALVGALLMMGAAGSALASQAPPPLADLAPWAGVYERPGLEGKRIWDDPVLQGEARKVLSPEAYDIVFNQFAQQVTTPAERKGDILVAFACKAHACNSDQVTLFVDLRAGTMAACLRQTGVLKEVWFATGKQPKDIEDPEGCASADDVAVYDKYHRMSGGAGSP